MSESQIPEALIAAQRTYDAAEAVLREAVQAGVRGDELTRLRDEVRAAVVALHRARAGTEFASWEGTQRLQKAARGEG